MPVRSAVANANLYLAAPYGLYGTVDGHLAIAMCPVDRLAEVVDCPALAGFASDRWFADRDAIKAVLRDHLATQAPRYWLARLEPAGIWAAPGHALPAFPAAPAFAALAATPQERSPEGPART